MIVSDSFVDASPDLPALGEPTAADYAAARALLGTQAAVTALGLGCFYTDDQPRADDGRWGEGGGGGGSSDASGSGGSSPGDLLADPAVWDAVSNRDVSEGGKGMGDRDNVVTAIAAANGFAHKPDLVDSVDGLVAQGWIPVLRGVQGADGRSGAELADEYRTGDAWYGHGLYGNGTYFARQDQESHGGGTAEEFVRVYAERGDPNSVVRAALPPDAKIVDYREARSAADAYASNLKDEKVRAAREIEDEDKSLDARQEARTAGNRMTDPGRWAALHGYDAIQGDRGEIVVLNRSIMKVERAA